MDAVQDSKRRVDIVPHTHWDREWHTPFQTFRLRLVELLDGLLPQLEGDPSYAHFMLDGQMAVVDDYLAVRPEAEERLRTLAASGRVSLGPWYALPDEFLVSAETLVRNLQRGLRVAARFDGAMEVGYLPDMFGHVAQMPQILRQLGFDHAVVWRGVPSVVDRSGFWWSSPDGSTVRAEYLPVGYGNGALVPDDAKALVRRIDEFAEEQADLLVGPILWMNGTDHLLPQPWLGRVVAEANALDGRYELRICSLADHVADAPTTGLPSWRGELRSGARANLLMGVASNRLDVKQAAARAERALEQLAEPLSALLLPAEHWPASLLDQAWLEVLRNSAHDSVCACSTDEVCAAVLHRYAEATHIADGLADRAVRALAATIEGDQAVIVNPSARTRGGLVELRLPGPSVPHGCQLVAERAAERVLIEETPVSVATVTVAELEYLRSILSFTIETLDDKELLYVEREEAGTLVTPPVRAELARLREQHAGQQVRIRVTNRPAVTVLARVEDVPGYGWRGWTGAGATVAPVEARPLRLSNGLVTVQVDPTDGTFAVNGLAGLGALVDGGDVGDTYNWCPPVDDTIVDRAGAAACRLVEHGPLRARLEIRCTLVLPTHVEGSRRVGSLPVAVRTTLELRAGEDLVRVRLDLDNYGLRDHRLRVHLPLSYPARTSRAECAFTVVERGLTAEGGPTELGLPTFPSRRFVQAGGLVVAHEGLLEYELVDLRQGPDGDVANTLALTLLRCTGMLSQGPMATRPLPAGPLTPMEGPQQQGPASASFCLHVGDADPYTVVDDAFVPLLVTRSGGGRQPADGRALAVSGAKVSAVVREAGALHVRFFNPTDEPATVAIEGRRGWLVDLRGRAREAFEGQFILGPQSFTTAALAD
ncbi:MAG: glycoside hydrolase family 38 C-terminal domain-containing protein [Acidimicrobiales bacterium]|nr:glycoside hydrolase family 38 C-terminal domain-containing protein [Acidimicrobiales bacterium]